MNGKDMQRGVQRVRGIFTYSLLVLLLAMPGLLASAESETWEVAGTTYTKVRVHEITPGTVTIFHSGGIKQLDIADLPADLQARFSYNPEEAKEWRQDVQEERLAAVAHRVQGRKANDKEDDKFAWLLRNNAKLHSPESVDILPELDLRPRYIEYGLSAKHQGRRPSCSVFAIVSALEYQLSYRKGRNERLSEEFLIWATQQVRPGVPMDTGFNFTEVITALQNYGVPPSDLMPNTFGKKISEIKPTREALEAARKFRVVTPVMFFKSDAQLLRRIIGALNSGNPVIIGINRPHWKSLSHTNLLSKQQPVKGYSHAVTLIGYRNETGRPEDTTFIFRNSYGRNWGVGGCAFMTAEYLKKHLLSAMYLDMP